jgi:hypothetical protein
MVDEVGSCRRAESGLFGLFLEVGNGSFKKVVFEIRFIAYDVWKKNVFGD